MTLSSRLAVDLFAGGGGASKGLHDAGLHVFVAVNHDPAAITMHAANHPSTIHLCESVYQVDPRVVMGRRRVDALWASPDCTHHSRAKGGKPRDQGIRGLAWIVVEWARQVRPRVLFVENVPEFLGWGPVDDAGQPEKARAGETFRQWVAALELLGYRVEWRVLVAADYGAPTTRRRLYVVARCDGQPIAWPTPTHGTGRAHPWRTAAECIDWSIPCPSIFERRKPLAEATQRRIAEGLRRYVLTGRPYLAHTARGPVAAFLAKHYGGVVGQPLTRPLGTVTAQDHHSLVVAFLVAYYGTGTASPVDAPVPTVVSRDRFGLVVVDIDGEPHAIADIGMRMLQPRELARAQGFPDDYVLTGTKTQQVARIGNSVCPPVARALVEAQFPTRRSA